MNGKLIPLVIVLLVTLTGSTYGQNATNSYRMGELASNVNGLRTLMFTTPAWGVRVIYAVVLMAMIDCWTGFYFRRAIFSFSTAKMSDGGSTISVGPGYSLIFWRKMDGSAYGPDLWFWGAPFIIDAAHRGVQVHWIWSR